MHLEPAPLTRNELIAANVILVLIFVTYTKSVFVDPGTIPRDWEKEIKIESGRGDGDADADGDGDRNGVVEGKEGEGIKSRKWCRKCNAAKPPRAHHCKECGRYVPSLQSPHLP